MEQTLEPSDLLMPRIERALVGRSVDMARIGLVLGLAVAQIVVGGGGGEVVRRLVRLHDGLQSLTRGTLLNW
jgi:hypothetical protein